MSVRTAGAYRNLAELVDIAFGGIHTAVVKWVVRAKVVDIANAVRVTIDADAIERTGCVRASVIDCVAIVSAKGALVNVVAVIRTGGVGAFVSSHA